MDVTRYILCDRPTCTKSTVAVAVRNRGVSISIANNHRVLSFRSLYCCALSHVTRTMISSIASKLVTFIIVVLFICFLYRDTEHDIPLADLDLAESNVAHINGTEAINNPYHIKKHPPLSSIVIDNSTVNGNVEFLLDFGIVGHVSTRQQLLLLRWRAGFHEFL